MTSRLAALAVAGVLAAACAPWPPHGQGGMAETASAEFNGMDGGHRLACTRGHIETMVHVGAETRQPALLHRTRLQWNRAARALAGGLEEDAESDMEQLDVLLTDLIDRLAGRPAKPGQSPSGRC
jgi:hypothetical protein